MCILYRLPTLLLLLFLGSQAFSQNNHDLGKILLSDAREYLHAPAKWNKCDWIAFTGVGVTTSVLFYADSEIHNGLLSVRDGSTGKFTSQFIEPFGDGTYSLPILAAVGTYGLLSGKKDQLLVAGAGLESFVFSAGMATGFKWMFQRERPVAGGSSFNSLDFEGPYGNQGDEGAFVSRHAATSFAVATVLASAYGKKRKWVPWLAYGLASAVTFSRVYNGKHWASDAFAGAAIGYATGKLVVRLHRERGVACFQP
ncbi:MAG: phosphatase PAP2 family protein [Bacteroidota bacterium]